MLPLRAIFEALGLEVGFDDSMNNIVYYQADATDRVSVSYTIENNNKKNSKQIIDGDLMIFFEDGSCEHKTGNFRGVRPGNNREETYTFEFYKDQNTEFDIGVNKEQFENGFDSFAILAVIFPSFLY